jgi:hypothetical protein
MPILLAWVVFGSPLTAGEPLPKVAQMPPNQRGVALGLYEKDPNGSYLGLLKEIKALGATHVSIVHPWYMKTAKDEEIYRDSVETTPWSSLVRCIEDAGKVGLEVLLFPILRVADQQYGWRGALKPEDVNLFFDNYRALMLRFATLAEQKHLAMLSVGSELASMEVYEQQWRSLIAEIRKVYSGKLVYSANWDNYRNTPFVDALDFAGVTGYFELAEADTATTVEDIIHAWRYVYLDLMRFAESVGKPLIITEVGYLSTTNAAAFPWKEAARNTVDVEIQRKCYEAFRRVWNREPRLEGVYFWQWFGEGGPTDYEYTPRRKPAAKELQIWYGGQKVE